MPTTLRRTYLTHKPPIRDGIALAATRWPSLTCDDRGLLERIVEDWTRRVRAEAASDPLERLIGQGVAEPAQAPHTPFGSIAADVDLDAILAADRSDTW